MNTKVELESNNLVFGYCVKSYEKALINVLNIHVLMFFITLFIGIIAESRAVLADSLDFIGDAASYFLSIWVLHRSAKLKAYVAMFKAMTIFGAGIIMSSVLYKNLGLYEMPDSKIMPISGVLGVIAHIICMQQLYGYRQGDSNMMSVWICTINDMLCNVLTIVGAILVSFTMSPMPDIIIACIIIMIAMTGSIIIFKKAIKEIIYE